MLHGSSFHSERVMWKRAIIVVILLSGVVLLLKVSPNSDDAMMSKNNSEFSPVIGGKMPSEAEDARMLQLHIEANSAMRTLMAKRLQINDR